MCALKTTKRTIRMTTTIAAETAPAMTAWFVLPVLTKKKRKVKEWQVQLMI